MSEQFDKLASSLFINQVPIMWAEKGFLSLKPLASWIEDLLARVNFLNEWIEGGTPRVFWISGFFFPQAFFTGTLQNYARKHIIAVDLLGFNFNIKDNMTYKDIHEKPSDGVYVWGMYLEGCKWDYENHQLADSDPKKLYTELPMIHFEPEKSRKKPGLCGTV